MSNEMISEKVIAEIKTPADEPNLQVVQRTNAKSLSIGGGFVVAFAFLMQYLPTIQVWLESTLPQPYGAAASIIFGAIIGVVTLFVKAGKFEVKKDPNF
jgi:hypothetical protein